VTGVPASSRKILRRQELVNRFAATFLVARQDHLPHAQNPLFGEEHVLGPAEADPLRPEEASDPRILRRIGVGADAERADLVRPLQQPVEVPEDFGLIGLHRLFEQNLDHFGRPGGKLSIDHLAG